jgi:hypothetical protein
MKGISDAEIDRAIRNTVELYACGRACYVLRVTYHVAKLQTEQV